MNDKGMKKVNVEKIGIPSESNSLSHCNSTGTGQILYPDMLNYSIRSNKW
jgi:hypothetical protein